jgi:MFS family permease
MQAIFRYFQSFFSHPGSRAVGLVFAASGMIFGAWTVQIPFVKSGFGFNDAQLGLLLFTLPLGNLSANPLAITTIRHLGLQRTTTLALWMAALLFLLPVVMPHPALTGLLLFCCGMSFAVLNIGMNTCATQVERLEKRRIMSTCHGLWSLGAMSGAVLAGVLLALGATPFLSMLLSALLVIALGVFAYRDILKIEAEKQVESGEKQGFRWPNQLLWGLIVLSMCTNLTEATMADWAAVYMRDVLQAPKGLVGWGFAAYAFCMASGRLMGDLFLIRYGSRRVLQAGGGIVAAGLVLAVVWPTVPGALLGFALVGAGVSLGAPVLYGAAAQVPGMALGAGLATMNTFAMTTFLAGPTVIGFIAAWISLPGAFLLVATVALFWVWKAGRARALG